jgi:hypothetical protein
MIFEHKTISYISNVNFIGHTGIGLKNISPNQIEILQFFLPKLIEIEYFHRLFTGNDTGCTVYRPY